MSFRRVAMLETEASDRGCQSPAHTIKDPPDPPARVKAAGRRASLPGDRSEALRTESDQAPDGREPPPPPFRRRQGAGGAHEGRAGTYERLRSILADHTCSITRELIQGPVFAEDGHLYEREAITRWLATHATSPRTNLPMGKTLVPSVVARQTIANLLEMDGVVSDAAAAEWHFARGAAAADREGARASFRRAAALGHAGAARRVDPLAAAPTALFECSTAAVKEGLG